MTLAFACLSKALAASNVFETNAGVPEWAAFFTKGQYEGFLDLVAKDFKRRGHRVRIEEGVVTMAGASDEDEDIQFGLMNLAQICAQSDESEWPTIIADHFDTVFASESEKRELDAKRGDFAQISGMLALRIWPEDYGDAMNADTVVSRSDLGGTITALVYDLPSIVQNVNPKDLKQWDKSRDTLFELALANVRRDYPVDIDEVELTEGIAITLFSGDHLFAAAHVLTLEDHPACLGTHGSLIGVPHRHAVICYPINDIAVFDTLQLLIPAVYGMYLEGPGSVSPHLYWYQRRQFTTLAVGYEDEEFSFRPTAEFLQLLESLAPESE